MATPTSIRMIRDPVYPAQLIPASIADPSKPLSEQSREVQAYEYYNNDERLPFPERCRILRECRQEITALHTIFLQRLGRKIKEDEMKEFSRNLWWFDRKVEEFAFYYPRTSKVVFTATAISLSLFFFSTICRRSS